MRTVLSDALDELLAEEPDGDGEAMIALQRDADRVDAAMTLAAAAFDQSQAFSADGAQTAAAWLATRCHLPMSEARKRISLGRKLRHLPLCQAAWAAGEITRAHVSVIGAVRRPATQDALARDEHLLVDFAKTMRFEHFARSVAYWAQHIDPDGAEDDDSDQRAQRQVHLDQHFQGMWAGKMIFDPISGTIVSNELTRLERGLFDEDWAEAKARLGREPFVHELARTPGQRRADALVEMAARSRSEPIGSRRPAPLFSVLVDYETLHGRICELADGTVVSPGALVPWLTAADIQRAVFTPRNRVEVGQTSRLFKGATRRAIELRDRYCTHPYCNTPGADCQGDHIIPYRDNGPTTQDNGELRCGFHNRLRNGLDPPEAPKDGDDDGDDGDDDDDGDPP